MLLAVSLHRRLSPLRRFLPESHLTYHYISRWLHLRPTFRFRSSFSSCPFLRCARDACHGHRRHIFRFSYFRHLPSSLVSLRCSGISHGGSESCLLWQLGPHTKYTATVPFRRLMMSKILQKSPDRQRQWSNPTMQPTAVPEYCPASLYENTYIAIRARSSPAVANLGLVRPMQNKAIQK
jgi:hypothetical protein